MLTSVKLHGPQVRKHASGNGKLLRPFIKCQYFNDARTDFHKTRNFIENRLIFMLLNCNCAKLANFEHF